MGSAAGRPRAVLDAKCTIDLRAASLADVRSLVEQWREAGPLGLIPEVFAVVCGLADGAELFAVFDTDGNNKVDALEVIAALVALCQGAPEEKLAVLFPVFDFAQQGGLSCNDLHIFVHSLLRGVLKVLGPEPGGAEPLPGSPELEKEVCEVCERVFDAYNLPVGDLVTQLQLGRWLRVDVEAKSVCDRLLGALVLPDVEAQLAAAAAAQAAAFGSVCSSDGASAPLRKLAQPQFQRCVPRHKELAEVLEQSLSAQGQPTDQVPQGLFATAGKAVSVFEVLAADPALPAKDARTLLRLFHGRPPSDEEVAALAPGGAKPVPEITWQAWVQHLTAPAPAPAPAPDAAALDAAAP